MEPGELFWRAKQDPDAAEDTLWLCVDHVPSNTKRMMVAPPTNEDPTTYVRADAVDVRASIIPKLLADSRSIYNLTPDDFEELILDRLLAMGVQAFRLGAANRKDGGIDIVFWTTGLLPLLGAVQVKHHRSENLKVPSSAVREMAGAMAPHHFNVGLIVTNTDFTADAKHQALAGSSIIQLRDGAAVRKWIVDDFFVERIEFETRNAEFCKGIHANIPRFL